MSGISLVSSPTLGKDEIGKGSSCGLPDVVDNHSPRATRCECRCCKRGAGLSVSGKARPWPRNPLRRLAPRYVSSTWAYPRGSRRRADP